MAKVKNIIINDVIKTNMGGIRTQNPILSRESMDEGELNEYIGINAGNEAVRGIMNGKSETVRIHTFEEGTVLTDEILEQVKSGDIVKVLQMEFIVNNKVNQSPRSITGSMVGAALQNSLTILKLDWVKGETLEPTTVTYTFATQNEEVE